MKRLLVLIFLLNFPVVVSAYSNIDCTTDDVSADFGKVGYPVAGDIDNNGAIEVGIFDSGVWSVDVDHSLTFDPEQDLVFTFGQAGDIPIIGDFDGNGSTEVGVFRYGEWYLDTNNSFVYENMSDDKRVFGNPSGYPVVGDWRGIGKDQLGVYYNGSFYLDWDGDGFWNDAVDLYIGGFGEEGAIPVAADWKGIGLDLVGTYQNGEWRYDTNANYRFDGSGTDGYIPLYGSATGRPVVGDWDADGVDDPGYLEGVIFQLDTVADDQVTFGTCDSDAGPPDGGFDPNDLPGDADGSGICGTDMDGDDFIALEEIANCDTGVCPIDMEVCTGEGGGEPFCPRESVLNTSRDMCQIEAAVSCPEGYYYESSLDLCLADIICPGNSVYNPAKDQCQTVVSLECPDGFVLSTFEELCVKPIQCDDPAAVLNPASGRCEKVPLWTCPEGFVYGGNEECHAEPVCPINTIYSTDRDRCETAVTHNCPLGYEYDLAVDDCVVVPTCESPSILNPATDVCETAFTIGCPVGWTEEVTPGQCSLDVSCSGSGVFDSALDMCLSDPINFSCNPGFTWNEGLQLCLQAPQCPEPSVFNQNRDRCEMMVTETCPPGGYTRSGDKCVIPPQCEAPSTYSASTDRCETSLESCPSGFTWSSVHDTCVADVQCESGGVLNSSTDKCELLATSICPSGTVENVSTGQCESQPICENGGIYSTVNNLCTTSAVSVSCPSGYSYSATYQQCVQAVTCLSGGTFVAANNRCELEPTHDCVAGYNFNASRGRCEAAPACSAGVYSASINKCLLSSIRTCPDGYFYESDRDRCERNPDCGAGAYYSPQNETCVSQVATCQYGQWEPTLGRCESAASCPDGYTPDYVNDVCSNTGPGAVLSGGILNYGGSRVTGVKGNGDKIDIYYCTAWSKDNECLNISVQGSITAVGATFSGGSSYVFSPDNYSNSTGGFYGMVGNGNKIDFYGCTALDPMSDYSQCGTIGVEFAITVTGATFSGGSTYLSSSGASGFTAGPNDTINLNSCTEWDIDYGCAGYGPISSITVDEETSTAAGSCPPGTVGYDTDRDVCYGEGVYEQTTPTCPSGQMDYVSDVCFVEYNDSCISGQYDVGLGACVITPACVSGGTLDVVNDVCILSPADSCVSGYTLSGGLCIDTTPNCSPGGGYSTTTDLCMAPGTQVCSTGYTYNSSLGLCTDAANCDWGGLNTSLDRCVATKIPDCASGYTLNGSLCNATPQCDAGSYSPIINQCDAGSDICSVGFALDSIRDKCFKEASCLNPSVLNTTSDRCEVGIGLSCGGGFSLDGVLGTCFQDSTCEAPSALETTIDFCIMPPEGGCDPGYVWDEGLGMCQRLPECAPGSLDASIDRCIVDTGQICQDGFTDNNGVCVKEPYCSSPGAFESTTNMCQADVGITCGVDGLSLETTTNTCWASALCASGALDQGRDICFAPATYDCGTWSYDSVTENCYKSAGCDQGIVNLDASECQLAAATECGMMNYNASDGTCEAAGDCPIDPAFNGEQIFGVSPTVDMCANPAFHECDLGFAYNGMPVAMCEAVVTCPAAGSTYDIISNTCGDGEPIICPHGPEYECVATSQSQQSVRSCPPNAQYNSETGFCDQLEIVLSGAAQDNHYTGFYIEPTNSNRLYTDYRDFPDGGDNSYLEFNVVNGVVVVTGNMYQTDRWGTSTTGDNTITWMDHNGNFFGETIFGVSNNAITLSGTDFFISERLDGRHNGSQIDFYNPVTRLFTGSILFTLNLVQLEPNTGVTRFCSPHTCTDPGEIEEEEPDIASYEDDGGRDSETGECVGDVYVFNGRGRYCRKVGVSTRFFNCCSTSPSSFLFLQKVCKAMDVEVAHARSRELTVHIGDFCLKRWPFIGCVQRAKTYCVFGSKMAVAVHTQGREQLNAFQPDGDWGDARLPHCRGFSPQEFASLDFSRIDLTEVFGDLNVNVPTSNITDRMTDSIMGYENAR